MTRTAPPPQPQPGPQKDPHRRHLLLVIGIPVLAVLVVLAFAATAAAFVLPIALRTAVEYRTVVAGSPAVAVSAQNARFDVGPSADGRIHLHVTGRAFGRPRLTTTTDGGSTALRIRCAAPLWFSSCDLRVAVAMPATSRLTVDGTNGDIGVRGIGASVTARTTNGGLDVRGAGGDLVLGTTNGSIRVTDAAAATARAESVNGRVDLGFRTAPSDVTAATTNGGVSVRVPGGETYAVTARTTNGTVDTTRLRTDPRSPHHVTAMTVNGTVQVVPVD